MKIYCRITKQSQKIVSTISPRQTGEKIFLLLLSQLKKKTKKIPYTFLERAIVELDPGIKLEPKVRRGKTTYIPKYLRKGNRFSLNCLLDGANDRKKNITFINRLTTEVLTTLEEKSIAIDLRDDFLDFVQDCFLTVKRYFKRYFSMKRWRRKRKKILKRLYKLTGRRKTRSGLRKRRKKLFALKKKKKKRKAPKPSVIRKLKNYKLKQRRRRRRIKQRLFRKTGLEKYKYKYKRYKKGWWFRIAPLTLKQKNKKYNKNLKKALKRKLSTKNIYFIT